MHKIPNSKGKGKGKTIAVCETSPHCYTGRGDFSAFTPAEAGTRFSDPEKMQG